MCDIIKEHESPFDSTVYKTVIKHNNKYYGIYSHLEVKKGKAYDMRYSSYINPKVSNESKLYDRVLYHESHINKWSAFMDFNDAFYDTKNIYMADGCKIVVLKIQALNITHLTIFDDCESCLFEIIKSFNIINYVGH